MYQALIIERTGWTYDELQTQPEYLLDALSVIIVADKKAERQHWKDVIKVWTARQH